MKINKSTSACQGPASERPPEHRCRAVAALAGRQGQAGHTGRRDGLGEQVLEVNPFLEAAAADLQSKIIILHFLREAQFNGHG